MGYVNKNIEVLLNGDVDVLKYKAILEYYKLIQLLEKGYQYNYDNILDIISLIDIYSELDYKKLYYKEFYLNG